jgi:phosphoribosyl 1,2-cyclic phosphodiesterase
MLRGNGGTEFVLRFSLLGSGSSGNAALIAGPRGKILIDCGLSYRQLTTRCAAIGATLDGLEAVFITHEHADHVNGLGVLARRLGVPAFMTPGTRRRLPQSLGKLGDVQTFEAGDAMVCAGMDIRSFPVEHDANDPVSFTVRDGNCQIGFATDLGRPTHLVRERLRGCSALVIESNYCPDLLEQSAYPPSVRRRIASSRGHLSNRQMAELLTELIHADLRLVVAVHISQENNRVDLARKAANDVLVGHHARLHVADQDAPTPMFDVLRQNAELLDHIA